MKNKKKEGHNQQAIENTIWLLVTRPFQLDSRNLDQQFLKKEVTATFFCMPNVFVDINPNTLKMLVPLFHFDDSVKNKISQEKQVYLLLNMMQLLPHFSEKNSVSVKNSTTLNQTKFGALKVGLLFISL